MKFNRFRKLIYFDTEQYKSLLVQFVQVDTCAKSCVDISISVTF
jgi:hypothetical protein